MNTFLESNPEVSHEKYEVVHPSAGGMVFYDARGSSQPCQEGSSRPATPTLTSRTGLDTESRRPRRPQAWIRPHCLPEGSNRAVSFPVYWPEARTCSAWIAWALSRTQSPHGSCFRAERWLLLGPLAAHCSVHPDQPCLDQEAAVSIFQEDTCRGLFFSFKKSCEVWHKGSISVLLYHCAAHRRLKG